MAFHQVQEVDRIVIRFAGDSGDGMQVVGDQFTNTSANMGEDVATLPDYPSEIRAPAGTVFGVSGFQLCFGNKAVYTPGDQLDVLLAMNPAALKVNLPNVKPGGMIIVNEDAFLPKNVEKAGFATNPLEDEDISTKYHLRKVNVVKLTQEALTGTALGPKQVDRCKNFVALGVAFWLFDRNREHTEKWLRKKFAAKPEVLEANLKALAAGWDFAEKSDIFPAKFNIRKKEKLPAPGTYRNVTGNQAAALGLIAAAHCANLKLFLGSYPITPATDILHELAKYRQFATIFQAEDEIAAIGSAIGAAFGGALAATTTSGPGFSLKSEFLGLAVMTELPLVVIDVQRAGPSTGIPTKTEQSDLFQALWGRHGESPAVVLAPQSPKDCFDVTMEAARIALRHMVPVIVLSDGYLGNGSEIWRVPAIDELPKFPVKFRTAPEAFLPYQRDPETLARPWAIPGTPGLEHRIGGLEKEDRTGTVSQNELNHEKMSRFRAEKVAAVAKHIPPMTVQGAPDAEVLVLGWGSTYGIIKEAVERMLTQGHKVACAHLRHLNPLPSDLKALLKRYPQVLIPENNMGQLWYRLRAEYLIDVEKLSKMQGQPFRREEIEIKVKEMLARGGHRR